MPKPRAVYVLLFRGVGGATQLPVAPLREALRGAGFENVATYINSGNAVLRSHLSYRIWLKGNPLQEWEGLP